MNKKVKLLALLLSVTMLICAMPIMGFADATTPTIESVLILQKPGAGNENLLDVTVTYTVPDNVGDQITLLATTTSYTVDINQQTNEVTNIEYIDQVAKPAPNAEGKRTFEFVVDKTRLAAPAGENKNKLYVRVGGSGITSPGELTGTFAAETPAIIYGDVNKDGNVTPADAALVLQYYAEIITSFKDTNGNDYPEGLIAANVNGDYVDGVISITPADAALILQKYAEIIDKFPVEQ